MAGLSRQRRIWNARLGRAGDRHIAWPRQRDDSAAAVLSWAQAKVASRQQHAGAHAPSRVRVYHARPSFHPH